MRVAARALVPWRPSALARAAAHASLWVLVLASGFTNATFNWGVTIGDVVRVVLLFYLMPLWAVLLAALAAARAADGGVVLRALLALAGALVVLWPRRRRLAVAARSWPTGWA